MLDTRTIAAFVAAGLSTALLFVVWWFGANFLQTAGDFVVANTTSNTAITLTNDDLVQASARLMTMQNQAVTMITSLIFGLFVLLGFALRPGTPRRHNYDVFDAVAGIGFLGCVFLAMYFGFANTLQALELLPNPFANLDGINTVKLAISSNIGQQAFWVGLSVIFTMFLVVRSILHESTPEHSGAPAADAFPVIVQVDAQGKVNIQRPDGA